MKAKVYRALVMDAGHAKLLCKVGRAGRWATTQEFSAHGNVHAHTTQADDDPHRRDKRTFVREMTAHLGELIAREATDALLLIAPPTVLGDLRAAMPRGLAAQVTAELAKDLVHTPIADLMPRLDELAGIWADDAAALA